MSKPSPQTQSSTSPCFQPEDFQRTLLTGEEREAVLRVMDKAIAGHSAFDRYGGEEVDAYEQEFADHIGTKYATAVSSGTAAMHAAVSALNLDPGSEVVCPPITDPGGIGPVLAGLCIPVFADTDPETFNVTAESIEKVITDQTRAIVVAHIAGEPCDMEAIRKTSDRHYLPIIEDVAQAHDATWKGKRLGGFGALGAFSMMSGKHHTSGGQGGMVVTNDEALYWRAKSFADRGKNFSRPDVGGFLGLNYRMTELEAAIGRVQLRRLPGFVARRQALAARLRAALSGSRLFSLGWIPEQGQSAYWFLRMRVFVEGSSLTKEKIAQRLCDVGIPAAPTYTSLITKQPWFANKRIFADSGIPWSLPQCQRIPDYDHCCPNAERALAHHMLIAFNESMTEDTVDRMAEVMRNLEKEM